MLNSTSSQRHGVRFAIKTLLNLLQHLFMFPATDAAIAAGRTLLFDGAMRASTWPIDVQGEPPLYRAEPVDSPFASRALILIVLRVVNAVGLRSEEHKSELQSLMRISYAVFC